MMILWKNPFNSKFQQSSIVELRFSVSRTLLLMLNLQSLFIVSLGNNLAQQHQFEESKALKSFICFITLLPSKFILGTLILYEFDPHFCLVPFLSCRLRVKISCLRLNGSYDVRRWSSCFEWLSLKLPFTLIQPSVTVICLRKRERAKLYLQSFNWESRRWK